MAGQLPLSTKLFTGSNQPDSKYFFPESIGGYPRSQGVVVLY